MHIMGVKSQYLFILWLCRAVVCDSQLGVSSVQLGV